MNEAPSPSLVLNQGEIADLFQVSPKTVQQWDRDGLRDAARLKSKGRSARYDAVAAVKWYTEREVSAAVAEIDTDAMDAAKLRKLEAEAESKELDVAVKRGDLVPLDEVESLVRESLEAVDSVLRHAPSRFAPALAKTAEVSVKVARALLREVIELVRGAIRETADPEANDAD